METSGANSNSFSLVRHGYDVDEVEAFLANQAEAWHQAVLAAENRAVGLEDELQKAVRREAALLHDKNPPSDGSEHAVADLENQLSLKRIEHEAYLKQLTDETQTSVSDQLADADSKAASIIQEAENAANESRLELEETRTSQLAALESEHARTKSQYEKAEAKLVETIKQLNTMRITLVDGLQAIADGGLTNAKAIDDLLDEIGLDADSDHAQLVHNNLNEIDPNT